MYASRGFQEIGVRRDYYEKPREDARVLMKRLIP
jgi:ribosomal protein S18 acetylase RimI-like enzyme